MSERQEFPVVIAGAGPVGLSLALGLAHHGVRSLVLEKKPELSEHSKALLVTTRTLEIFREWGLLERFREAGRFKSKVEIWVAGDSTPAAAVDLGLLSDVSAIHGVLILPQDRTEALLLEAVRETGLCEVRFGHELTELRQAAAGVSSEVLTLPGQEYRVRSDFLVGCDGPRSRVRAELGWELEGKTYPSRIMLADVRVSDERAELPWPRIAPRREGVLGALSFGPGEWRLIATIPPDLTDEAATAESAIRESVDEVLGAGPYELIWSSVFRIHCRNAPHFVRDRVILAGDAAHLNSPAGGQGMNAGIHDAHNLAWKLFRALEAGETPALLRSYEQERRGVVLGNIDRFTDLLTRFAFFPVPGVRGALAQIAKMALQQPTVVRQAGLRFGMLTAHYGPSALLSGDSPLIGTRAPDVTLRASDGTEHPLLTLVGKQALLLLFDDGRLPRWRREDPDLQLTDVPKLDVRVVGRAPTEGSDLTDAAGVLARDWRAEGGLAVLVRPDGHVGWAAMRPTAEALRSGVMAALGAVTFRRAAPEEEVVPDPEPGIESEPEAEI